MKLASSVLVYLIMLIGLPGNLDGHQIDKSSMPVSERVELKSFARTIVDSRKLSVNNRVKFLNNFRLPHLRKHPIAGESESDYLTSLLVGCYYLDRSKQVAVAFIKCLRRIPSYEAARGFQLVAIESNDRKIRLLAMDALEEWYSEFFRITIPHPIDWARKKPLTKSP